MPTPENSHQTPHVLNSKLFTTCLIMLFLIAVAGIYLFRPLYDPDFYWHLKTGQWIWQNKALPDFDPFGIPPSPGTSSGAKFVLTSYWLHQIILYAFYSLGGMSGIIVLRLILAGIALLICVYWTKVHDLCVAAVIAIGTMQVLKYYYLERPQFASFICAGALIVILFRFLEQDAYRPLKSLLVPLTLLMIVWANLHGGFLVGQLILIYISASEGIKFIHPSFSPILFSKYRILLISSVVALAASLINPNGLNQVTILSTVLEGNSFFERINPEYQSIFVFLKQHDTYVIIYFLTILFTAISLLLSRHKKILPGSVFLP